VTGTVLRADGRVRCVLTHEAAKCNCTASERLHSGRPPSKEMRETLQERVGYRHLRPGLIRCWRCLRGGQLHAQGAALALFLHLADLVPPDVAFFKLSFCQFRP
jgi:hypothetical protein